MLDKKITLSKLENTKQEYKKIIGFDIETSGDKNDFVLATFYSDKIKKVCYSKQDVKDFLQKNELRNYNIFATNLAFDFLGSLYQYSEKWDINERNGVIYSFKWFQQEKEGKLIKPVNFYDTIRILPFSVAKLGVLLKIPKLEHPTCFGRIPKNPKELKELETYCFRDSEITYKFIKDLLIPFLEKYNLSLKSTIGSIALEDFRRNYLDFDLFQESEQNREICFKAYYGGRTETFQRGVFKNVYCFDINSLYPSVMIKELPNPNKSTYYKKGNLFRIQQKEGVSEVEIYVPESLGIPPLPFRTEDKLIFPTGILKGYYNHNELRNAISYGCIIREIGEQLVYPETHKFFNKFVKKHYKERLKLQAENNPLQVLEKNILNNLYGKFAFNYKNTSSIIPAHSFDFNKHVKTAVKIEPLLNNTFVSYQSEGVTPPCYSFPILSSYITSYARIEMYKYLANRQIQNKIIATDTDSIFLKNYEGEIKTSDKLGKMKLEEGYPIKDKCYFIKPKMYKTFKPKCKGVKFNNKNSFNTLLDRKPIKQQRFTKYRTAVRSLEHHKNGVLKPNQIIEIEKEISLEDNKRVWFKEFNEYEEQQSKPRYINCCIK